MATFLVQPVIFLFVLGTGLSQLSRGALPHGISYRTFVFPGVVAMSVLIAAMFSAGSITWDREFGFLREMLVAPVRRWAIVFGKCLAGATVASLQGVVILCLAGAVGVPYDPLLLLTLLGELILISFTITSFGVMMAAKIRQFQGIVALNQMLIMPLFFLSGAMFPLNHLPAWLAVITRIDPITYIVHPMRDAVTSHLALPAATRAALSPPLTWGGWAVPTGVSLGIVAVLGLIFLSVAIRGFRRAE
jgi:ABC-2 type transport system permease protein